MSKIIPNIVFERDGKTLYDGSFGNRTGSSHSPVRRDLENGYMRKEKRICTFSLRKRILTTDKTYNTCTKITQNMYILSRYRKCTIS